VSFRPNPVFKERCIKFYRQATNKIVGTSDEAAAYFREFF
jgi:hypothetical protein